MSCIKLAKSGALSPDDVEAIAFGASLVLRPSHWRAVAKSHAYLHRLIGERRRIYGVTTGYGPLAHTAIDPQASAQLQQGLVYHLATGVGALLDKSQVRAIMAVRAATLAHGYSAVAPDTLQLLLQCLAQDLVPQIPAIGTVGASGDLTPLAHIALALMGQGQVWLEQTPLPAAQALDRLGLAVLRPEGKDALALVNGTSAMTAIAALNHCRSERLLYLSLILTGVYGELLHAHREALHPGFARLRAHPGQQWAQHTLLTAFADSARLQPIEQPPPCLPTQLHGGQTLAHQAMPQDAYTFRCAPQHLGAVRDVMEFHHQVLRDELAAVTDNPLLLADTGEVLHGGNFFGQHIALAADALNNALITLAIHSERRIARITDPALNQGLPPFLRGNNNGLHSGFMGAQVSATALVAEMRTQANPASIQSIATNANNQDVVTMGTLAARRCATTLDRLQELLAIECLILAQGYDIAGGEAAGFAKISVQLQQQIRQTSKHLDDDRPLSDEIKTLSQQLGQPGWLAPLIKSGA
ncbi:HAL/PAL/TAL family ammonia-lyase [Thiorhodospira sibirica]|uniref:HAL/PAL/TAL family ammonia-lyase n=1 Tax=Thiorhodospira sibirica TaxID=154347 RepID=UPI00022C1D36|nr:aromatic amino acid ammonia-lyase [Thiorhodospira sibirica]